jgi:nitrite reductase/ring-hydroxylating ferredoxin subunit
MRPPRAYRDYNIERSAARQPGDRLVFEDTMPKETVAVAKLADLLPGTLAYADVDGLPIALANVAGIIYAFSDTCRHEGGPLSSGALIEDTITCPWHGWTYNIRTGKAIVPPVGIRIPTYPVHIAGDDVFVTIDWPDEP